MTSKEFDNYSFSINTKVKEYGTQWQTVVEIDFRDRTVVTKRMNIIFCEDIVDIKD